MLNLPHNDEFVGYPNVPVRHYSPEDRIALAQPAKRPASLREAILDVNVPSDGDYLALNSWRARYGLDPVTR